MRAEAGRAGEQRRLVELLVSADAYATPSATRRAASATRHHRDHEPPARTAEHARGPRRAPLKSRSERWADARFREHSHIHILAVRFCSRKLLN